uniref:Uncharacterized protein n=1 Tax=Oryza glumipatula TaxID=40148 RepID=A0A0E0BIA8_9ORYZ
MGEVDQRGRWAPPDEGEFASPQRSEPFRGDVLASADIHVVPLPPHAQGWCGCGPGSCRFPRSGSASSRAAAPPALVMKLLRAWVSLNGLLGWGPTKGRRTGRFAVSLLARSSDPSGVFRRPLRSAFQEP